MHPRVPTPHPLLLGLTAALALLSGLAPRPTAAFEPNPATLPLTLHVVVEVYELPREVYNGLAAQQPGVRNDEWMHQRIRALMEDRTARLTEHHSLNTRSGQRASIATGGEVIYGTEFNEETAMPTAFETRRTGAIVELDPVIGPDNFTIDLTLALELCEHLGTSRHRYTNPKTKKSLSVEQPRFYSRKIQAALTCHDGAPRLMGNVGAKGDPDAKSGTVGVVFVTPSLVH